MPKLPSFQFYPGDWLKDPNLRRCSLEARGVWVDMLCLMFECEERGVLSAGGEPWSDDDIAAAIGGDTVRILQCVTELLRKGVCHRNHSGAIFSRRLVRDEQIRQARSKAGKQGGRPAKQTESKTKAKRKQNRGSSTSSSSSPSGIEKKEKEKRKKGEVYSPEFERFWCECPKKVGKAQAWKAWPRAVELAGKSDKKSPEESVEEFLLRRIKDYSASVSTTDIQFIRHPSTWLNGGNWDDEIGSRVPTKEDLQNWRPH